MSSDQLAFIIVAAFVAFLIGLAKGGFGGMPGALAVPIMALVIPATVALGITLPMLMLADIFAVASHWRRWDKKLILLLIPGAVLGVSVGTYVISNSPTEFLRTVLGIIILIFAIYKIFENRLMKSIKIEPKNWHGLLAGTITGFSSSLAHTGGPPVSIYLLLQDVTPRVFIGTSVLFFMILNWIKVPYYWYAGLFDFEVLKQLVWIIPLIPVGVFVGRWFSIRVRKELFDKIIIIFLGIAGLLLIFA